jgi:nucleotide-binding universal stress UspA family protein
MQVKKNRVALRNILVPVDGSLPSRRAVVQAAALARRLGARITLFHAITPFEAYVYGEVLPPVIRYADFEKHATQASGKILSGARKTAAGTDCLCRSAWNVSAADAIVKAARTHRCDLIVMGSHGRRGLERMLLGSVAQKVLAGSRVPVMICR